MPHVALHPVIVLGQSQASRAATDAVLVLGVLIVLVLVGGFLVMHLRRRFLGERDADAPGLLLDDLRGLRARGEISDEEYDRARAAIVGRMSEAMGGRAPGPPPSPRAPALRSPAPADPTLRVARPGYDLTGAPLPRAASSRELPREGNGPPGAEGREEPDSR